MPLRDHFRPPADEIEGWESLHGQWPAMLVLALGKLLPKGYVAVPRVHAGPLVEIDVAAFEKDAPRAAQPDHGGGAAVAVWAPPRPTLRVQTDLSELAEYEVRVYDTKRLRRLVAAIELVSPSNKDRPDSRQAFVVKCVSLLNQGVSVSIIDLVTVRHFNLYDELLTLIGHPDPTMRPDAPPIYAAALRRVQGTNNGWLDTWSHTLQVGRPLPTLPLWLSGGDVVPLELELVYEDTCRALQIP
jgi:hypothetical protein